MPNLTISNTLDLESFTRISLYTLEEFNKYLENLKPYTLNNNSSSNFNSIETLKNTLLDYNKDLKLLVNSKSNTIIKNNISAIITSLLVSILSL